MERRKACMKEMQTMVATWIDVGGFYSLEQSYEWLVTMYKWLHGQVGCPEKIECPSTCPGRSEIATVMAKRPCPRQKRLKKRLPRGTRVKISLDFGTS